MSYTINFRISYLINGILASSYWRHNPGIATSSGSESTAAILIPVMSGDSTPASTNLLGRVRLRLASPEVRSEPDTMHWQYYPNLSAQFSQNRTDCGQFCAAAGSESWHLYIGFPSCVSHKSNKPSPFDKLNAQYPADFEAIFARYYG